MTTPQKPTRRPAAKTEKPYHWFKGASVRALYDQIAAAGPDTARLEVRTEGDQMFLRVVRSGVGADLNDDVRSFAAASSGTDIDDSRRCPPICQ